MQSQNNGFRLFGPPEGEIRKTGSKGGAEEEGKDRKGEMPEWSIGPHSKCGVRVTVPGVRIPLSPQGTLRKVAKNPVNHAFTGFLFLAKVLKKASESRLSVAYSVYFFSGRKSTPNCS